MSAISDDEIQTILDVCQARFERGVDTNEDRDLARLCEDALGRPHGPCYRKPTDTEASFARARCAGVFGARKAAT